MDGWRMSVGDLPDDSGWGNASRDVRVFQLGDVGLIDVVGQPPRSLEVQRAVLWMWAASPSGLLIRVNVEDALDESALRVITAAGELVHTWPGTPIGVVSHSGDLRRLVAQDHQGHHLSGGVSLADAWQRMRSRGVSTTITIDLTPTMRAARTARQTAVRACLDWNLTKMAARASLVTGELVARSVAQGAHDIHYSVSRQGSRVRVLVRDDSHSPGAVEPATISEVLRAEPSAPVLSDLSDSYGEFALDGHQVRWAVMRDEPPARGSARAMEIRTSRQTHARGRGSGRVRSTPS